MSSVFETLMLWLLMAVAVTMVVLSARARKLEREEGLASSGKRLIATSLICAAVTLLVLGATASALFPPVSAPPTSRLSTEPSDPAIAARKEKLDRRKAELYAELERIDAEIADLLPEEKAPDSSPAPRRLIPDLGGPAHYLVPILVMLGTVALVTLGDPATLLRRGRLDEKDGDDPEKVKALAELDKLALLANAGQFAEGLQVASAIEVGPLDKFDRLDLAYLKSYCAVQVATTGKAEDRAPLDAAVRDLDILLEQAPNRGEAAYLLGMALGMLGDRQKALDAFENAKSSLANPAAKLPFAHNESVCLLGLAEEALGRGDADGASKLFDEVTKRGVLVDRVPMSLVKVRLLNVRRSLREGDHDEAAKGIAAVRTLEGIDAEQRPSIEAICEALETLIAVRQGDPPAILKQTETFLAGHLPPGLPEPDEEIAEEYLESPAAGIELRLSPQIFRAFLFLQAEAQARIVAKSGRPPDESQVASITRPLFRALQFELRQRDVLATLGGIYYWFVPDGRKKALAWLEAASALGFEGRIARRLLERARSRDLEQRESMQWFRSTSSRFLQDPTIAPQVRKALIEELGRFREFQPLLLEIDPTEDLEPREPTIRLLRERAGYLESMVADLSSRKSGDIGPRLQELRKDYQQLIAGLDDSTGRMAEIERRLVQEVGMTVIS